MKIDGLTLGRYGRMRLEFIKSERTELLFAAGIEEYLAQIDTHMKERIWELTREIARTHGVAEELKARDQMAWVGAMNTIKSQVEKIAIHEIIEE